LKDDIDKNEGEEIKEKMAMGRGVRVFHTPGVSPYSVLIDYRGVNQSLLLESQAILTIEPDKADSLKRSEGFVKLMDGYGILGNLRLSTGDGVLHYLVLISGCVSVGKLSTSEIYKVTDVKLVSLRGYTPDEEKVAEVRKLLASGSAYFSWSSTGLPVDLTLAAQKSARYKKPDARFFWNRMLYLPYIRAGIDTDNWLTRIMFGSIEIRTVYVGAKQAKAAIVSRLSNERAGTRFVVRGVDDDGHVANFVETEQIVQLENDVSSHVQIRGSVPLFWEQPGVNVGSHKIRMSRGPELSAPAFENHLNQTKERYGNQVFVNLLASSLVGSKEGEATLSTAFQTHHKAVPEHNGIPHVLFDYHAESGTRRLEKLEAKVGEYIEKMGYFYNSSGRTLRVQDGVIRSNCADCLDRTNAVQLFIGLKILQNQLKCLKLNDKENIVARFEDGFRQMWVNNGNNLSKIYAGTGALNQGGSKLLDGARSAARTIQNNLLDKDKQEAFDLLIHGTGRNTDFADRVKLLLPPKYFHAPVPLLQSVVKRWSEFTDFIPLRVAVGTYNINGGKHFRSVVYKDVSLDDWLLDAHLRGNLIDTEENHLPIDIFAIGFEEMVDLDAKNIVNTSKENAKEWAVELCKTLSRDERYCLVTYQQLVGVCLYIFVRPHLAKNIKDVFVDDVKTGMGGATGNKGAVAISLTYRSSSLCFLCSHFAAGQSNITERNNDYSEAIKKVTFPNGRSVLNHDFVFWCGDFNYRVNMSRDDAATAVKNNDLTELLAADQLKIEQAAGNIFQGFHEGDITFPPTYKYDLFSDDYDTSEKCRVPAWTDRVLYRARKLPGVGEDWSPGNFHYYGRAELKQSDHRPVLAVIDIQVREVDRKKQEGIVEDVLKSLGPSDGTVVSTPLTGPSTVKISEDVVGAITSCMAEFGDVRYSREVRGTVWTQFREGGAAATALSAQLLTAAGVEWQITAPCPEWREMLDKELELVDTPPLPLTSSHQPATSFRRQSAKLMSQLSQLSFEELEGIVLSPSTGPPPKPPPPRPAPPPARTASQEAAGNGVQEAGAAPPPSAAVPGPSPPAAAAPSQPPERKAPVRPTGPPSRPPPRPGPPPPRPAPPSAQPPATATTKPATETAANPAASTSNADEKGADSSTSPTHPPPPPPAKSAGFSDLFSAPSDPDLAMDIPISLSSESLMSGGAMTSGEATPAPTKPSLPTAGSLEYPEDYDPLLESGKCWDKGVEQKVPSVSNSNSSSSEEGGLQNLSNSQSSTPTNETKAPPPVPTRPAVGPPPSGPPPSGPPPGPPPKLPSRPPGGRPPPPPPKR